MEHIQSNKITLDKSTSEILEAGIIINEFKEGVTLEVDDLLRTKEANLKLANNRRYTVVLSFGYLASVSKETREVAASKDFKKSTIAMAVLTHSVGQRLMGNFYMNFNKPYVNTRLFNDKELAIKWLREQLNEQNVIETDWKN
ncbi:MAG: hypothetical protein ACK50A_00570 [Sphingobacteriaceae bacterium]